MSLNLKPVKYEDLTSKQKESYNYQQVSAIFANYGFMTIRLSDDWKGADFIAQHIDGKTFLKVQLKTRLSFYKKYNDKDIYVCFRENGHWYLYPHDELQQVFLDMGKMSGTSSWDEENGWNVPSIPKYFQEIMNKYKLN